MAKKPTKKKLSSNTKLKTPIQTTERHQEDDDRIKDYFTLCTKFECYISEYRHSWKVALENSLVFYKMDLSDQPMIVMSIKIDQNLKVHIFTEYGELESNCLLSFLNRQLTLEYWSQLQSLLKYFEAEVCKKNVKIERNLQHVSKYMRQCLKGDLNGNPGLKSKLNFIYSQVYALTSNRFTHEIVDLAYHIYIKSSFCYNYLQGLNSISLPNVQVLLQHADEG